MHSSDLLEQNIFTNKTQLKGTFEFTSTYFSVEVERFEQCKGLEREKYLILY